MSVPSSAVPGPSGNPSPESHPRPVPPDPTTTAIPASVAGAAVRQDLVHPDPLLDCLVEICRLHGQHATRASLSAGLPLTQGRLSLPAPERAGARGGMAR